MNLLIYPNSKGKRQKAKGKNTENNPGVFKLFVLTCSFALCVLSFNFLSPTPSFAQCQNDTQNEGLISTKNPIDPQVKFGNSGGICVTGDKAFYREAKVPEYNELENQYYILNRSSYKKTLAPPTSGPNALDFSGAGNGVYLVSTNMTVNSVSGTPGSGAQIIFVKGNLNITSDINYADSDPDSGLVFIVEGKINIYSTVRKINAILISFGQICTAYLSASSTCANGTTDKTLDLTINGSLISFYNPTAGRDDAIMFRRNLVDNFQKPAEIINQQAKYLYILRNGLFTKDLIITTEDRHYQIPL